MRRLRTMLALAICLLSIQVAADDRAFNFAGIPWGTSAAETIKLLGEKGFTKVAKDKDGDYTFEGELLGFKSNGVAVIGDVGLVKIIVRLVTPDRKAREVYGEMKKTLTTKYGEPTAYEYFTKPYYEGDGYEDQAIRLGKGKFVSFWSNSTTNEGLMLDISDLLTVDFTYESPFWSQEAKKRKAKATSVF
jgi:hypothetical protein